MNASFSPPHSRAGGNPVRDIIFMGSPAFAVPSLKLLAQQFNIAAVYTQPPRPAGRGQTLQKTPVHQLAENLGLPVRHPDKLKGDDLQTLLNTPADALAVVAYGLILPKALVESRLCLNVHPSALPRWRGAAPLQHTLLAGDKTTEVCIMKLDAGMDTGPVYRCTPVAVPPAQTFEQLHDLCAQLGAEQLADVLGHLDTLTPVPQQGNPTHAGKITAEMRRLNWAQPAETLHNTIRAIGGTAQLAGETLKLAGSSVITCPPHAPGTVLHLDHDGLTIACGQNALHIAHLQRPGKTMTPAASVANGWPALTEGALFT